MGEREEREGKEEGRREGERERDEMTSHHASSLLVVLLEGMVQCLETSHVLLPLIDDRYILLPLCIVSLPQVGLWQMRGLGFLRAISVGGFLVQLPVTVYCNLVEASQR